MAKYNVGDVLEITEDFVLECAVFSEGEKYTIAEVEGIHYYLESDVYYYVNSISEVDTHSGFRKVEPKVEFKVGDKVRLLETAHGSPDYSCDTPEKVKERLASAGLDYQTVFEVDGSVDSDGDVHVFHPGSYVGMYVLAEFLVPWVEGEDKPLTQEVHTLGIAEAAPKPETVSVDALREAYEYVNQEYLDIEKLIELAKRLS